MTGTNDQLKKTAVMVLFIYIPYMTSAIIMWDLTQIYTTAIQIYSAVHPSHRHPVVSQVSLLEVNIQI